MKINIKGIVRDKDTNVIRESVDYYDKIVNLLEVPYYQNLRSIGISEDHWESILSKVFNQPVRKDDEYLYDSNGNELYQEEPDGYWYKWEYDSNDNLIYFENSYGDWSKNEYDSNGSEIYYENSIGYWYKREYDDNGNEIYHEDSEDGVVLDKRNNNLNESVDYYDKLLNILDKPYFKNLESIGIPEEQWETILSKVFGQPVYMGGNEIYDSNGSVIYRETSDGTWYKKEYDDNGQMTYSETSDGYWEKYEYDSNGNMVYYENSKGYWYKSEYDSNGNRIYSEDSNGHWRKYEYDSNGNVIYHEDYNGFWFKKEYNENGQMTYIENSDGVVFDNRNNNLNESVGSDHYYDKIVNILEPPYYQNLRSIGIPEEQWNTVFSKLFNQPIRKDNEYLYDSNGNRIYSEDSNGYWIKQEYDSNGNLIYHEDYNGFWFKKEYNENGNEIYHEDSNGYVFDRRNNNLNESTEDRYYDKLLSILQPPYYQNLETMGIPEDQWETILSKLYNQPIRKDDEYLYDKNGNLIYREYSDGYWEKSEYDDNGKRIYSENSNGYWINQEYDSNGNEIYHGDSNGYWDKYEYDDNGNVIYHKDYNGYWEKYEYDEKTQITYYENSEDYWSIYEYDDNGNQIYHEDSEHGVVFDLRNNNLNESIDDRYYDKIVNILDKPYYQNLETMGIDEDQWKTIFSKLFNQPVYIDLSGTIRNDNQDELYQEDPDGFWFKSEYDNNGNVIHYENSDGYWYKSEYDSNGNEIYYENSNGYWDKWEYDSNGNETYYENSDGEWEKSEYNDNGNIIYFENSDGEIRDNRNNNLNESVGSDQYYDKLLSILQPPYYQNLRSIGIPVDQWNTIFSKLFGEPVEKYQEYLYGSNGNQIYYEDYSGDWNKYEFDENENLIYREDSDGTWGRFEYDDNGNQIYYENSKGYIIDNRNNNLNESVDHYDKLLSILQPPYFKNLETMGIPVEQYYIIFERIFNQHIEFDIYGDWERVIYNGNGNEIYEESDDFWKIMKYDEKGNLNYFENSDGYWRKQEYNEDGKMTYKITSDGDWYKWEYDNNRNIIYYETSDGVWWKWEYDDEDNVVYFENSDGLIRGERNNNNLNESVDYYDKIVNILEVPYFKNLRSIGIDKNQWGTIFNKLFNQPIEKDGEYLYDKRKNTLYSENPYGHWYKYGYDENGNQIYYEDYTGYWEKSEYDSNGNQIYFEDSYGYWEKSEYDSKGNQIYHETSTGYVFDRRNNNLNESVGSDKYYDKLLNILQPPYFQNLISWGIPEEQWETIFNKLFNQPVKKRLGTIYDKRKNPLYSETSYGFWLKNEYDEYGNKTYHVNSDGYWYKNEYDSNGNVVYFENSLGEIIDKRNNNNLNESVGSDHYYDKLLNILQPPYFQNLRTIGISEDKYESIFSKLFDHPVKIVMGDVYNSVEYLENGNEIYYENSDGFWTKYEYDENENEIYSEDSNGNWEKYEYDSNGNQIYFEKSDGYWFKKEYNENGQITYIENSNGVVIDYGNNGNLNESVDDRYYDKIVNLLEVPYFKNLETIGISEEQYESIFSKLFNQPVYIDLTGYIRNGNDNEIYYENSYGDWYKKEYDENENIIYREDSEGYWYKKEYDKKGNQIYIEDSDGYWVKFEYDENDNRIYHENSDGVVFDQRNNNLNESIDERLVNMIDIPYFQNLISWGIPEKQWETILSNVFNKEVTIRKTPYGEYYEIYDQNNELYSETPSGDWFKYEYNKNGDIIYDEDSEGTWGRFEYNDNGDKTLEEYSDGYWIRYEYDDNGVIKVTEDSDGALIVY